MVNLGTEKALISIFGLSNRNMLIFQTVNQLRAFPVLIERSFIETEAPRNSRNYITHAFGYVFTY